MNELLTKDDYLTIMRALDAQSMALLNQDKLIESYALFGARQRIDSVRRKITLLYVRSGPSSD